MRHCDVIVDNAGKIEGDIVLGHTDLAGHLDDLDLDVDLDQALRKGIDLDETWVDGTIEATEFSDQTNVSLRDGFVWIRADDTAGDCAEETDEGAQRGDWKIKLSAC